MRYDAVNIGPFDLALKVNQIKEAADSAGITLLAKHSDANSEQLRPAIHIVRAGPTRVALIGAVPGTDTKTVCEEIADLTRRVRKTVDLIVVLSQLPPLDVERCANELTDVDLFLSGRHDVDLTTSKRISNAYVLPCSLYGQTVGVAEIYLRPQGGIERLVSAYHRLDSSLAEDPLIKRSVGDYYAKHSVLMPEQASVRATEQVLASVLVKDGNSQASCQNCHEKEFASWKETPHAHGWQTLVEKDSSDRADCISCHTTPQLTLDGFSPASTGVGCATCHGGDPDLARHPTDPRFIVRRPAEAICQTCHTPKTSPSFSYAAFLERVMHNNPKKEDQPLTPASTREGH
jgi:hypothetical protein